MRNPPFFDGLAPEELAEILRRLEHRRFPAGAVVLAEGDQPHEMYVTESGAADVFVSDRAGVEHRIAQLGPGAAFGEMSLFTGQPCVGTVRAAADLEVVVLSEDDFDRVTEEFPRLLRNLGVILAERLARTNRLTVRRAAGRVGFLLDAGAPPLLGYALASSVAWHARAPVLLLVVDNEPPEKLTALATLTADELTPYDRGRLRDGSRWERRAHLAVVPVSGGFTTGFLASTVEDLSDRYEHVLVQVRRLPEQHRQARIVTLAGTDAPAAAQVDERSSYAIAAAAAADGRPGPDPGHVLRVPPFSGADEGALATGLLPPTTAAGRALGWAARDLAGLKVGLALGAGSSKGYAHIGVLEALGRLGLEIDYLVGTSIGALVAAGYALGFRPGEIADMLDEGGKSLFRPTLPIKSLVRNAGLRDVLRHHGGETRIEQLPVPLALVAADLLTRREVVFRSGSLWLAVLASISIPGIYPAQRIGAYALVDGGVVNPVPSNVAAEMGADVVIAVKLGVGSTEADWETEALHAAGRPPSVLEVITRSIEIMQSKITTDAASAATIVITPDFGETPGLSLRRFTRGRSYVELGEAAVEAALPRLSSALPWLRASDTARHVPTPV